MSQKLKNIITQNHRLLAHCESYCCFNIYTLQLHGISHENELPPDKQKTKKKKEKNGNKKERRKRGAIKAW